MKSSKTFAALFSILVLSSCSPSLHEYIDLDTRALDLGAARSILIQVDRGELEISGTESGQVEVSGQVLFPADLDFQFYESDGQIVLKIEDRHSGFSDNSVRMKILVPNHSKVFIETDGASVLVQDFLGDLEVASVSGDLIAKNIEGELALRSNRGNITVQTCSGRIGMVGNYGLLSMQDNHGEARVSTIMGTVVLRGMIQDGDAFNLETDHGPVEVDLLQDSALELIVHSTSGDVACMLPNLMSSTRSCEGQYGDGEGSLNIRTVSGSVTIRLLP